MSNTIQGRDIASNRFGSLAEFTGSFADAAALQAQFTRDGYVLLRQAIDRSQVLNARREVLTRLRDVGEIEGPIIDGRLTGRSDRPDPALDQGQFWRSVNDGPELRGVTHGPATQAIVASILGAAARPHELMYLRPMAPGLGTPLHYDYPFFAKDATKIHTVWLPLGDITLGDGPLAVIEKSFQFDDLLAPIRATRFDRDHSNEAVQSAAYESANAQHPVELAEARSVRILSTDFQAGDMVVFSGFLMHGSLDNHSPNNRVRLSCDVRYQPFDDPYDDDRYFGQHPRGSKGGGYADMRGAQPLKKS
jgi:ectoine hydroxylase-related dioxygenase (phytanoyl-CoA dioxygenase family)